MASLQGELISAAAADQNNGVAPAPVQPVSAFPPAAIVRTGQQPAAQDEDEEYD
jgi:hypothetical protein